MKRGLEGREEGETHTVGLWMCTNKVLSLKRDVLFFKLGCCFQFEMRGVGALSQ